MPYFETNRTRLFFQDWGTGRAVVFVHGWAVGGGCWEYQMVPLSRQGLRCIAYDQRGCGRSDDPGIGFDYDTLADDLALLIEHLGLRDVALVGHSMGGGVIARYLARHGDGRIDRIVLAGTTTPFPLKAADNPTGFEPAMVETLIGRLMADRPKYIADIAPGFFGAGREGCAASPEMMRWAIDLAMAASPLASVEMLRTNATTDQRKEIAEIRVPTLILHGDADESCPVDLMARATAALIPGSRLEVYAGAAHGLMLTHADRFNADLVEFLG